MNITLTGLDEKTDFYYLKTRIPRYFLPRVEFGILLSMTSENKRRYPSLDWIKRFLDTYGDKGFRFSIHVCGKMALEYAAMDNFKDLFKNVERVQLNGNIPLSVLYELCIKYPSINFITQHNTFNEPLLDHDHIANHHILIDGSGGRGISPKTWSALNTNKYYGFAGGLGLDNISTELPKIKAIKDSWIDMESKLRIDDWFQSDIALECIRLALNDDWFKSNMAL